MASGGTAAGSGSVRAWMRAGLAYQAASFMMIGAWATLSPRHFYDGFPGGGRRWVAGDGPYNAHLASDAGAGFLAVGVVALLASLWMERRVTQAASMAAIVHALLHLVFHLNHPHPALDSVNTAMSNGGLALSVVVGVAVLVMARQAGRRPAAEEPTGAVTASVV